MPLSIPTAPERDLLAVTYDKVKEIRVVDTDDQSKVLAIENLAIAGTKVTVAVDGLSGTVDGAFEDVLTQIAEKADTTQVEALDEEKVDKATGKSLIADTEITRLASVTNQTLSGLGGEAVSNKKTTLTDSDTDYPTCKAVKTAVDANNQTWVGVVIDPTLSSSEPAPKSTVVAYRATELLRTGNLYYHKAGNSRIFNAFQIGRAHV